MSSQVAKPAKPAPSLAMRSMAAAGTNGRVEGDAQGFTRGH